MRACVCVPLSVCFHETAVTSSRVPSKVVSSQNALPKVWSVHRMHYQRSVQFTEYITKGLVSSQNALPKVCSVHRMHYQRSVQFIECITKGLFGSQNALPKVCSVHRMHYQRSVQFTKCTIKRLPKVCSHQSGQFTECVTNMLLISLAKDTRVPKEQCSSNFSTLSPGNAWSLWTDFRLIPTVWFIVFVRLLTWEWFSVVHCPWQAADVEWLSVVHCLCQATDVRMVLCGSLSLTGC